GKAGAGQQAINERKHARAGGQALRVHAHLPRESDENTMDFRLLFLEEADELVVLLDGFKRFHINRLSRRAGAVNDAGDTALKLAAHGNDEALAADGDDVVLRRAFAA